MKRENFNYLVVGVFVFSIMVFTIVVMYKLAVPDQETEDYYAVYKSIMGIKVGSTVTHGGYQIGSVTKVERVNEKGATRFKLQLRIKKGWKIPKGSSAEVVAPNLLSIQLINIIDQDLAVISKKTSKLVEYHKAGDTIDGKDEASMMIMLNGIAKEVTSVSESSIKPLLTNLNEHINKIGIKLSEQIPQIAENTNRLLISLNQSADQVNKILGVENRGYITSILRNADQMSAKMLEMTTKLDQVRAKLANVMVNVDKIVSSNRHDVSRIVKSTRKTLDAISSRITTIVGNIEQTSRNMSEFTYKIRKNPGLIIRNKKVKERGVLTN